MNQRESAADDFGFLCSLEFLLRQLYFTGDHGQAGGADQSGIAAQQGLGDDGAPAGGQGIVMDGRAVNSTNSIHWGGGAIDE